jgi:NACalpha-BTF3-like transcription factor
MSELSLFQGMSTFTTPEGETNTIKNITTLRDVHKCDIHLDVWCKKDTLSENFFDSLNKISNVSIVFLDSHVADVSKWNRESVKAIMAFYSDSQEIILFNDDIMFDKDPAFMFDITEYKPEGVIMFPYAKGQFTKDAQYSEFVKHFLGESCDNLPKEQAYVFDEGVSDGQTELYQDNGVMVIIRTINIKSLSYILNVIKQIHEGETEYREIFFSQTFWLSLVKNNQPFHISPTPQVLLPNTFSTDVVSTNINALFIDDKLCYSKSGYIEPDITTMLEESLRESTEVKRKEAVMKIRAAFAGIHNMDKTMGFADQMNIANSMYNTLHGSSGSNNEIMDTISISDTNDDIQTIVQQTDCTNALATRVYNEMNGDIVDSIMRISEMDDNKKMSVEDTIVTETQQDCNEVIDMIVTETQQDCDETQECAVVHEVVDTIVEQNVTKNTKLSARDKLDAFKNKRVSNTIGQ